MYHLNDHLSVTSKCTIKCVLQVFLILKSIIIYNYNSFKCYIYMYFHNSNKYVISYTVIQYSGTYTYHKYLAFLVYL